MVQRLLCAKRDDEAHPDFNREPFEAALERALRGAQPPRAVSRTLYESAEHGRAPLARSLLCGLHLAALWTLAFVQPLFDLLGKNPAFFVARDNTGGDVLIFALVWALGPPLVARHRRDRRARSTPGRPGRPARLHHRLRRCSAAADRQGHQPARAVVLPIALVLGLAAAAVYARSAGLRSFVSILGVAPSSCWRCCCSARGSRTSSSPARPKADRRRAGQAPRPRRADDLRRAADAVADEPTTVDAERYPNFARLAKTCTWYQNASSVSDGTYVAVPAILTGKRPHAELPTSHTYPDNLFTLLGPDLPAARPGADHQRLPRVAVRGEGDEPRGKRLSSLANDLSIVERRLLLPKGMANKLPPIDRDWEDFRADAGDDGLAGAAGKGREGPGGFAPPATTCPPSASARASMSSGP